MSNSTIKKGVLWPKTRNFPWQLKTIGPAPKSFGKNWKKKSPLKKILLKLDTFSDAFPDTSVPVRVLFTVEKSLLKGRQYLASKVTRADSHLVTIPWRDVRFRPRIWPGQNSWSSPAFPHRNTALKCCCLQSYPCQLHPHTWPENLGWVVIE